MRACRSYLSLMARSTLYKELALFVVMLAVLDVMLYVGDKKPVTGFCVALGVLFCATVVYGHKVVAKYVGHGWTAMYEIVMVVSIVVFACCSIGCW